MVWREGEKIIKKLLPILFVLIITSCSKEVSENQLVERDGLYYEVNFQKPFSGRSVNYFDDGTLQNKSNFKDGKRDGLHEFYDENGPMEQYNYKDGKLDGPSIVFHENGSILSKYNFKEGKFHGTVEYFGYEGQLIERTCYQDDETVDMSYCE